MTNVFELSSRQKEILRAVVQSFVESAIPVASQHIARDYSFDLSTATIRHELANLEELGFINHPHTSAGRIPTDQGYRFYVDSLMMPDPLSNAERRSIHQQLELTSDAEEMLRETSKILSRISHQLVVISFPHLSSGILERIELVSLSSARILVVLTLRSKLVKTITMEVLTEIPREKLEAISRLLNERLSGLTLQEIRGTFAARVRDFAEEETGLIRLFIYSRQRLFDDTLSRDRLCMSGTQHLSDQPEFGNSEKLKNMMDILADEEVIVHILDESDPTSETEEVRVSIGSELKNKKLHDYSVVVATYRIGDVVGEIGLLGPKRMKYARAVSLLDYTAQTLSTTLA